MLSATRLSLAGDGAASLLAQQAEKIPSSLIRVGTMGTYIALREMETALESWWFWTISDKPQTHRITATTLHRDLTGLRLHNQFQW